MRAIGRDPLFVARAEGAHLVDVDGNRYVDWVCSWGPLIHGHAHPEVLAAVADAAARGTTFGAPTEGEVELAEEVGRRIPSVAMLRMTSSGTEASMSAIRLARAATGRRARRSARRAGTRPRGPPSPGRQTPACSRSQALKSSVKYRSRTFLNSVLEYSVARSSMQSNDPAIASRMASHSTLERPWAMVKME